MLSGPSELMLEPVFLQLTMTSFLSQIYSSLNIKKKIFKESYFLSTFLRVFSKYCSDARNFTYLFRKSALLYDETLLRYGLTFSEENYNKYPYSIPGNAIFQAFFFLRRAKALEKKMCYVVQRKNYNPKSTFEEGFGGIYVFCYSEASFYLIDGDVMQQPRHKTLLDKLKHSTFYIFAALQNYGLRSLGFLTFIVFSKRNFWILSSYLFSASIAFVWLSFLSGKIPYSF